jgi:hypothetical protein
MEISVGAQTRNARILIDSFEHEFARLHFRSRRLTECIPIEILYRNSIGSATPSNQNSIGESVLRSAAVIEQTFGGITTNLWDDPFEWTLPETLATSNQVMEYLAEVEETRRRAFLSFTSDAELQKSIALPSGDIQPLVSIILQTLVRASDYQGRAIAIVKNLSDERVSWANIQDVLR